jgi:ribosome assembly protein RRB1
LNPNIFISASDDGNYKVWDTRSIDATNSNSFINCFKASEDELLCASFNYFDENIFATGGESTGIINVWDLRMPKTFLNDLNYHKDKVTSIEWSPFN